VNRPLSRLWPRTFASPTDFGTEPKLIASAAGKKNQSSSCVKSSGGIGPDHSGAAAFFLPVSKKHSHNLPKIVKSLTRFHRKSKTLTRLRKK
jgi:hypothetical protein